VTRPDPSDAAAAASDAAAAASDAAASGAADAPDAGPELDRRLEQAVSDLLAARAVGATICPSEAARRVADDADDPSSWRPLMAPARDAVGRLVAAGEVEVTQRGQVVDLATVRGPIRVRRRR
jgi:hypothetical protein